MSWGKMSLGQNVSGVKFHWGKMSPSRPERPSARNGQKTPRVANHKKSILIFLETPCRQRNSLCIFTEKYFDLRDYVISETWLLRGVGRVREAMEKEIMSLGTSVARMMGEGEKEEEDVEYKEEQELFEVEVVVMSLGSSDLLHKPSFSPLHSNYQLLSPLPSFL